jgi:hypothetical protein
MAAFHHDDMNDKAVQPPPSDKNNDEPIGRLPNKVVMITAMSASLQSCERHRSKSVCTLRKTVGSRVSPSCV